MFQEKKVDSFYIYLEHVYYFLDTVQDPRIQNRMKHNPSQGDTTTMAHTMKGAR